MQKHRVSKRKEKGKKQEFLDYVNNIRLQVVGALF